MATLAAAAIPQSLAMLDRSRAWAATRYLASRMALARAEAAKRSAYVALRFEETDSGITFGTYVDGNSNGVRTRDIERHVDRPLDQPIRLSDLFPGVAIALSTDSGGAGNPLRIGSSRLLSFSPLGSSTPGTIYIRGRDGSQLAVRIRGLTGRIRVLRYAARTRTWAEASF